VDVDSLQLKPEAIRRRPRLPHPAWGLVFVGLAIFDLCYALNWLAQMARYGARPTSDLVLRIEGEVALGMVMAMVLTGVWFWASSRDLRPALMRFIERRPRFRVVNWLGVLFIALLYMVTFLPVLLVLPEGPAGRALAAVPLDIAMAVMMFDLRRLRREAEKIIREVTGEAVALSPGLEAALQAPEVAGLRPEDLLEAPRWYYNLPGLLAVVQGALLLVGAAEIPLGWAREPRLWWGIPWEVVAFGGSGIAIGLWGYWHEWRQLRRPGRAVQIALRAILKERRDFPFYFWDWWGYTVILLALGAALVALFPLQESQMRLAGGALAAGYGIGITPLYPHYARPWRLAGEIVRAVRGV
jgi:hypothetical protein